jgi:hypothetical protein
VASVLRIVRTIVNIAVRVRRIAAISSRARPIRRVPRVAPKGGHNNSLQRVLRPAHRHRASAQQNVH